MKIVIMGHFELRIKVQRKRCNCATILIPLTGRFDLVVVECRASTALRFEAVGRLPISPPNFLKFTWYDRLIRFLCHLLSLSVSIRRSRSRRLIFFLCLPQPRPL